MSSYGWSDEAFLEIWPLTTYTHMYSIAHVWKQKGYLYTKLSHISNSHTIYKGTTQRMHCAYHKLGHVFVTWLRGYTVCVVHVCEHALSMSKQVCAQLNKQECVQLCFPESLFNSCNILPAGRFSRNKLSESFPFNTRQMVHSDKWNSKRTDSSSRNHSYILGTSFYLHLNLQVGALRWSNRKQWPIPLFILDWRGRNRQPTIAQSHRQMEL